MIHFEDHRGLESLQNRFMQTNAKIICIETRESEFQQKRFQGDGLPANHPGEIKQVLVFRVWYSGEKLP
jgi:hypothetical protein